MRHPKCRPLNGLPDQIGNPAGTASRHGNCPSLLHPTAAISMRNQPATFFPDSAPVAQNLRCLIFTTVPHNQDLTAAAAPPAPAPPAAQGQINLAHLDLFPRYKSSWERENT